MWDPDAEVRNKLRDQRRENNRAARAETRRGRSEPPAISRTYVPPVAEEAAALLRIITERRETPTPTKLKIGWRMRTVACWPLGDHTHEFSRYDGYEHIRHTYALFADGIVRYADGYGLVGYTSDLLDKEWHDVADGWEDDRSVVVELMQKRKNQLLGVETPPPGYPDRATMHDFARWINEIERSDGRALTGSVIDRLWSESYIWEHPTLQGRGLLPPSKWYRPGTRRA